MRDESGCFALLSRSDKPERTLAARFLKVLRKDGKGKRLPFRLVGTIS